MFQPNIELNLDQEEIRLYIEEQLKESIQANLWFVDLEKIAELSSMSKRYLEDEVINDVRMKAIEIRKNRKRWWPAGKAFEVIMEITSEW